MALPEGQLAGSCGGRFGGGYHYYKGRDYKGRAPPRRISRRVSSLLMFRRVDGKGFCMTVDPNGLAASAVLRGVSVLEVLEAELYKILGARGVTAARRFFVHC